MYDTAWHEPLSVGSVGALNLKLSFGAPAGVRLTVSWWQPKWQCPSDLLSRILAVPSRLALHAYSR